MYDYLEAALDRAESYLDNCEAGVARVREGASADDGRSVTVRESATDRYSTPVREVQAHDSAIVTAADRLFGAPSVTFSSSPAPSHGTAPATGARGTAVRESAARAEGRTLGDRLFDFDPAKPPRDLSYKEAIAVGRATEALERASHKPSSPSSTADARLVEAWNRACGGNAGRGGS